MGTVAAAKVSTTMTSRQVQQQQNDLIQKQHWIVLKNVKLKVDKLIGAS